MNYRGQIICAWAGAVSATLMFIGLIIAGVFPPKSPDVTPLEIAAYYQAHGMSVRIGMIFVQAAGGLFAIFAGSISAQLRRIEHRTAPALSYAQLALGAALVFAYIIPAMFWMAAAYRPDRDPNAVLALSDMAWLMFVGTWSISCLENLVIGFLILADKRPLPVFPRWIGFFNIWIGVLFTPAALISFFTTGPFAWNGLFTYWIPASVFGLWFYVMTGYLIRAINQQKRLGE